MGNNNQQFPQYNTPSQQQDGGQNPFQQQSQQQQQQPQQPQQRPVNLNPYAKENREGNRPNFGQQENRPPQNPSNDQNEFGASDPYFQQSNFDQQQQYNRGNQNPPQQGQNPWSNQNPSLNQDSNPTPPPQEPRVNPSQNENLGGGQRNSYQNPPQYRKSNSNELPQYRNSQQRRQEEQKQQPQQPSYPSQQGTNMDGFVDHFRVPQAQESSYRESFLNPTYTFETFIEGDCNRLARSAGIAIARKPGATAFNPLVVYGGVGLGKTHLAQAVGNEVKLSDPSKFVLYVSSEQFTTQFIEALKNNNVQQFTNYYLQVDVLIVDDIQFLAKKEKTQENFFHIFNRLHQNGKQIIMTSDRPPRSLEGLTDRLLSRFKWGLTADIQKPDFETRVAIVKQKLMSEGVNVPDDVVEYLSYNIDSNIRELEGTLVSLVANASLMQREVDLDMAKNALLNIVRNTEKEITIEFIQQIVSEYFGISVDELKSKTRKKDIAQARQIAMYFSKEYTKEPLKSIGNQFGGRDHSTVVHASKAVTKRTASDALYNRILEELLDQMNIKSKG
ncbi:chromosomal replication initiator protein DnaA [Flammeovirga sp. SubArs3]|uniref:chromosomal replication initiator protein DnaA n=1 Tax=Flammeovirga sp. SubArs3 TaxID=2995316 RepID=UPI00248B0540|nr:chromosomal replication initiator protein DnaA [Flammeovirga sp. SubArs3]